VPSGPYGAYGPFPPEILQQSSTVYEEEYGDSLHEAFDNVRMFRCKDCQEVLYEDELDSHDCEEEY
jgi:acetyl-CoA carboxylase beta subunit